MRMIVAMLALIGVATTGCFQVQPQPLPATTMSSWGPAGGFTMSSGSTCSGHATLIAGQTTVTDPCFTGVDNIVMCTDNSTAECRPMQPRLRLPCYLRKRERHDFILPGQIVARRLDRFLSASGDDLLQPGNRSAR